MWLNFSRKTRPADCKRPTFRPTLEALEARWVPSTLTVLNTNDSGAGSLRADIAAAHRGDTINFAAGLNGQTITLTSGELLINKNLTIAGPGASQLTVSGNNATRVFDVAKVTVALSGLTISNGSANGSTTTTIQGGGIYNAGTLTVRNCILANNIANNEGGGIANDGALTVSGSTLSNNSVSAGDGGGIFNYGTLTVSGSTLSGNHASEGGGIYDGYRNGTVTTTVSNSTLTGNSANNGGGIFNGGTLTVSDSTLSGNSAHFGGGIFNYSSAALTVSNSILSSNSAAYQGGGVYNNSGGTVTVKNSSSIAWNTAPVGFGADVYNLGVLYQDSSSIISILNGNPAQPI